MATKSSWARIQQCLANSTTASILWVYIATLLTLAVTDRTSAASVIFTDWKTWFFSALISRFPSIIRAFNPKDPAFGVGRSGTGGMPPVAPPTGASGTQADQPG